MATIEKRGQYTDVARLWIDNDRVRATLKACVRNILNSGNRYNLIRAVHLIDQRLNVHEANRRYTASTRARDNLNQRGCIGAVQNHAHNKFLS